MSRDQITQIRISGLRVIENVTLDLAGLTVLIGDNGVGKSSILEAFELLRQAAKPTMFVTDILMKAHGGLQSLLRRGSKELRLGVTIEGEGPKIDYEFTVGNVGTVPTILWEWVDVYAPTGESKPLRLFTRQDTVARVFGTLQMEKRYPIGGDEDAAPTIVVTATDVEDRDIEEQTLLLPSIGGKSHLVFQRVINALGRIDVHVPFETRPLWQQREIDLRVGPRWPSMVEKTGALARYAVNLPNVFQELRNRGGDVWERTLARVKLGLGDDVRDFSLSPFGRGNVELEILFGSAPDKPLPAEFLSEGQLSYLCFVALAELHERRSVLAFDEPELHLHPALLARVVWMLEEAATTSPVILSTHSDRLLDALSDPARSVVLCELDEARALRVRRPNAERLAEWLESYRGFGSIRAEGYESHVFAESSPASENENP